MEKNKKLHLHDIVEIVASKQNLTKEEADVFVRTLFSAIQDSITIDNPIKIKDFGTFKLTHILARESVNVNTGEKIEIPAHYRFSFSPATVLKETVNRPFSVFESTLLYDEIQNEDESEEEGEEIDIEDESENEEDDIVFVVEKTDSEKNETVIEENEMIIEEEIVIEKNETSETPTERKLPKNAFAVVFGIAVVSLAMLARELMCRNFRT